MEWQIVVGLKSVNSKNTRSNLPIILLQSSTLCQSDNPPIFQC
jgi:hypothetical protein